MNSHIHIQKLQEADIKAAKELIKEYIHWTNEDLSFQNIGKELATFPDIYREPEGSFLVVKDRDAIVGCVGMKKIDNGICEMKRLYVKDAYKGMGIGKELVKSIIEEAKKKGYQKMRLDTLKRMEKARRLYGQYDFYEIDQYVENPLKDAIFMEKDLSAEDSFGEG